MPRETGLSVSDPGVAKTVDPAGTEFEECEPVLGRSVSTVAPEAVACVGTGEGAHRVVADDLGDDARCGHRRALCVGPRQTLDLGTERKVAVSEATPGVRLQGGESPAQGLPVRKTNAVTVDPPGGERHDGDGFGTAKQRAEDPLSLVRPQQFGVVDPGDHTFAEDDGRGDQWSCQRTAASLIGPG